VEGAGQSADGLQTEPTLRIDHFGTVLLNLWGTVFEEVERCEAACLGSKPASERETRLGDAQEACRGDEFARKRRFIWTKKSGGNTTSCPPKKKLDLTELPIN